MEHTDRTGIGERVRILRERKGWSQGALARAAGIGQATVAKLETDPHKKTQKVAEIARALDVDPCELDPRYERRPMTSPVEDKLSRRSVDTWDRLIYAAVDEAFRVYGAPHDMAAVIAAEILAAIDAPLRVPPGMTDDEVVRRVVRWEMQSVMGTGTR